MTKKQSDELAIDFSKVLGVFKKSSSGHKNEKPKEGAGEPEQKEEFSLDLKGIWDGIFRYKAFILILIPIILGIMLRVQPLYLSQTDAWAENSVQSYYRSQISSQVSQQYPNLPAENMDAIINEEVNKYISTHKSEYEQQVTAVSQNFKSYFQDETGQTYLTGLDEWQWYRYGADIVDHGYMGDVKVEGIAYDKHMLAPYGVKVPQSFHPYLGAYLYKVLGPITGMNLMGIFFILPAILMALAVIPAFFIGRRLGGDIAGFFVAMLVAIHPAILTRTMGGSPDTDSYTVLFPLFIVWLFIEAIEAEDLKKKLGLISVSGFLVGLFSFAWSGWWYIFDFIVIAFAGYLAYLVAVNIWSQGYKSVSRLYAEKKDLIFVFVMFLITSALFVSLFTNFNAFTDVAFRQPLSFIVIKEAAKATLWPNVYTTVAELNPATISSIIGVMGGKMFFAIGLIGLFMILLDNLRKDRYMAYFILTVIWFFAAIYASTKGIRFTIILAPAYAIAFGVAVGSAYSHISGWVSREMNISQKIVKVVAVILLLLLLVPIYNSAAASTKGHTPLVNDAWASSLSKIKNNSTEQAIITSWWDFGHWFKALADRPVTFDGASQNVPQAHWVGRALLTPDEDEAVGILRMLDCGANRAFEAINNETDDIHRSVDMLHKIIIMDKEDAKKELSSHFSEKTAENVLKYTHCQPPEGFFITSEDMVGKAGVWAHFGSWDFEKAKIWRDYRRKGHDEAIEGLIEEFNYSRDKAESIYNELQSLPGDSEANTWISPWPGYAAVSSCSKNTNTSILCSFNLQNQQVNFKINITEEDAFIETSKGPVYPTSFVYVDRNGQFREKKYQNNTLPYSLALAVKTDGISGILVYPQLASSMFTRLFYFDGAGIEHFDLFDYQRDPTGLEIYTWKIDWDGKGKAKMDS